MNIKRLFTFSTLLFLITGSLYAGPTRITVGIESNDFAPYTYGTESKYRGQGALIDLLKSFEKELGVKFLFKVYPWKRCLRMLKESKIDAVFNASFKKERMKIGVYPFLNGKINALRGTHSSNYVLYKKKKNVIKWDGKGFTRFKGFLGAERGFSIVSDLKKMGIMVREVGSAKKGLIMTYKNRIQGFVTLESPGDFALKNLENVYKNGLIKSDLPVKSKRYYIIFSHRFAKSEKIILEKIWKSIEDSNNNGITKELVNKWLEKVQ